MRQTRRDFLASAAAGAAGLLIRRSGFFAQAENNTRRIDIHHHFISPAWKKQLAKWNAVRPIQGHETHQSYDPVKDIAAMDQDGTGISFLSVTTPGMWFGDIDETRRVVREPPAEKLHSGRCEREPERAVRVLARAQRHGDAALGPARRHDDDHVRPWVHGQRESK